MIRFYEDHFDLDKENPQLDVIRDLVAARKKCWIILCEMKRTLVTGDEWKNVVGKEGWRG